MDEKRQFFRIKNHGEIQAQSSTYSLDVVEISSSGAVVIKKNIDLQQEGVVEVKINNFSMEINYEILRIEDNNMILVFNNEEQTNKLFQVLKHLRDEQKKKSRN